MILLSKQRIQIFFYIFRYSPRTVCVCVLQTHLFLIVIGVTFYMLFMVIAIFFISFSISTIDLCELRAVMYNT